MDARCGCEHNVEGAPQGCPDQKDSQTIQVPYRPGSMVMVKLYVKSVELMSGGFRYTLSPERGTLFNSVIVPEVMIDRLVP